MSVCSLVNPASTIKGRRLLDTLFYGDYTKRYIKDTGQILILLRGVPGSGKSTLCRHLQSRFGNDNVSVCSADNYHMVDGEYKFVSSNLSEAHCRCIEKAEESCKNLMPVVIIDNTNITKRNMNAYFKIAANYQYLIIMVTVPNHAAEPTSVYAERNIHNVSEEVIHDKLKMFQQVLPNYTAWWLNRHTSQVLRELGNEIFKRFVKLFSTNHDSGYYNLSSSRFHVTALYTGEKPTNDDELRVHELVEEGVGKVTSIVVTAITITERTLSARVQLPPEALHLYDNDKKIDSLADHPGLLLLKQGHGAHITIGCARDIPTSMGRRDTLLGRLCQLFPIGESVIIENFHYDPIQKVCIVELDEHLTFRAMYAGCYKFD